MDALEAGLTELLDSVETLSPADRGSRLRRCVDQAVRIRVLREQLRAFDGFDTVSPTTVEILPALRSIAAEVRPQVEGQGIRLECEIPDDGGVCVSADVSALQRVIVGLVANAIAALAQRDHPCLRLLAQVDEEQVTLTVEDNGVGIPREDQELIFAPRFSTMPARGGLGLAIARNILTRMNGAIDLRSEAGQGTIVEVALPRLKGASAALDFSGALLAHLAWKRRLTEFVEGTGDMAGSLFVEKDDLCPLGAWIYGEGAAHASHPAYAELRSVHAGFHQAAARVVRAVEWNRLSQARELLAAGGAYATQSVGVIAAILRMGARVVDWDRQLDLGFETLDAHHKELSILLRALEETSRAKAPPDEMAAVLMHLMASATDRFEAEQDLMRISKYGRSALEEHVEAHNYFLDQVLRLQKACSFGKAGLLSRTVELLRPWLVDHRRVLDGALAKHLQSARYPR